MTVRPILFSSPMIVALLAGRKTQTRRLAWREAPLKGDTLLAKHATLWQRVQPGDLLWVRETWKPHSLYAHMKPREIPNTNVFFRADDTYAPSNTPWVTPIHMPRWASRLTLEVTATKIEPVQSISREDATAEGVLYVPGHGFISGEELRGDPGYSNFLAPRMGFETIWRELHGDASWEANPEVVVLQFAVHKINVDQLLSQRRAA